MRLEQHRRRRDGELPLSFAQMRCWYLDRDGAGAALNVPLALRLRGPLDEDALAAAVASAVAGHEALRTALVEREGVPFQRVAPDAVGRLSIELLDDRTPAAAVAEARRRAIAEALLPFDLGVAPLLRARLLRLASEDRVLLLTAHHAIVDGGSMAQLFEEIAATLTVAPNGATLTVASDGRVAGERLHLSDFACWQRARSDAGEFDAALSARVRELAGVPDLLLPGDRRRRAFQRFHFAACDVDVDEALAARLRALAQAHRVTLATLLLAAWQIVLARRSGQRDFAIGLPVSDRDEPAAARILGLLTNTVVVRAELGDPAPFVAGVLPRVRTGLLAALEQRALPLERLVERLRPPRDGGRHPVFQALFSLGVIPAGPLRLGSAEVELLRWPSAATAVDLDLRLGEEGGRLLGRLLFDDDLFDPSTAERIAAEFVAVLRDVVQRPEAPWDELGESGRGDLARRQRLESGTTPTPPPALLHELVAQQAARTPGAIAVCEGVSRTSYSELVAASRAVARTLRRDGIGAGDFVAVAMTGGRDRLVATLGVLMAGAAFLPLDPGQPRERLATLLRDARPRLVLDELPVAGADRDDGAAIAAPANPSSPAYVLYTSGSTGAPKGVVVSHAALTHVLRALLIEPGVLAGDVLFAAAAPCFDVALAERFAPLLAGATVAFAPSEELADSRVGEPVDGVRLAAALDRSRATIFQATPSTFALLRAAGWTGNPRLRLWCAGEELRPALARELLSCCGELWNLYGPTEATIYATLQRVTARRLATEERIPIGRPLPGVRNWVLDSAGAPVPPGGIGELHLGGAGLADGYLSALDATARAFLASELDPGGRVYRTGDRARVRSDGALEFHGRVDRQRKIRGHRIEPEEVEAVLAELPAVSQCAVVAREEADGPALIAFVVLRDAIAFDERRLRAELAGRLPPTMVPRRILVLSSLPRNPAGKVDLPALERAVVPPPASDDASQPLTEAEAWIADLWNRSLGSVAAGRHDRFFDLGGHSLLALETLHQLRQRFGATIEPRELLLLDLAGLAHRCAEAAARAPAARNGAR